ncbi:MAG: hypothetical protein ACYC35_01645 [Pirellulales bacterium]
MAHRGRHTADDVLVSALAAGKTVEGAAKAAHVSPRTAHRRLSDPGFRSRVTEARAQMFQRAAARLTSISIHAAQQLGRLIRSDKAAVSLGACRAALDLGMRAVELVDLEARLAALEAALSAKGDQP